MSFYLKNSLFLLLVLALLPIALPSFVVGLVVCGIRGGYATANEFAAWLTR